MIVTDLSNSFNPVKKPKDMKEKKKVTKIKKKKYKLAKLENNRFSIITENLDKCFICGAKKEELHEVFEGKNRQMSMKYGLVIPICRKCHKSIPNNKTLREKIHKVGQKAFKNRYKNENFMKIFGKNYL